MKMTIRTRIFLPAHLSGLYKFQKISIVYILELEKKRSHALHVMRKSQSN